MSVLELRLGDLGPRAEIADGAQGRVYRLLTRPGDLFKEYHAHVLPSLSVPELRRLISRPSLMRPADRQVVVEAAAWPYALVVDGDRCVGFLMRQAPDRYSAAIGGRDGLLELQFLLHPVKPMWRELSLPTADQRREFAGRYVQFFRVLHRYDVIIGDVSMRNFLWTLRDGPGIFALDCDGYRLNGHHPAVPQLATPDWEDPSMAAGRATLDSDRYKLALLVIRVLLANPYLTPEQVLAKEVLRERLGAPLVPLVRRAAGGSGRPHPDHWLRALSGRPSVALPRPANGDTRPPPSSAEPPRERPRVRLTRTEPPAMPSAEPKPPVERPTISLSRPPSTPET